MTWISFFFYLQLKSALKAHDVPWQKLLPIHPPYKLFTMQGKKQGYGISVSILSGGF